MRLCNEAILGDPPICESCNDFPKNTEGESRTRTDPLGKDRLHDGCWMHIRQLLVAGAVAVDETRIIQSE